MTFGSLLFVVYGPGLVNLADKAYGTSILADAGFVYLKTIGGFIIIAGSYFNTIESNCQDISS